VQRTPEAIDIIAKFQLLSQFGWGNTISNMDNESYYEMQLMLLCKHYEHKAMKMKGKINTFYAKEGM